jgi:uncharacterized membrane protein YraQ (UPF0718 family)
MILGYVYAVSYYTMSLYSASRGRFERPPTVPRVATATVSSRAPATAPRSPRAHHPLLALAVAAAGVAVVVSPHWWADAWQLSGVSPDFLGYYLLGWLPFGVLALLTGWRGLISPWVALGAVPVLAIGTLRALESPSGIVLGAADAAAPLALCGMAMPVCECGSVPVARRLIMRGVHPGAGVAFMLAAPILNPVVLFSTAVAYAGNDAALMVASRAGLGLVLACASGLLIARMGAGRLLTRPDTGHHHAHGAGRVRRVMDHLSSDFFFMGKFVVAGAALAAAMQTLVPQDVFTGVLTTPFVGAALLMVFAFLLSLCSEADAFVAISFVQFPVGAQLAFLVFGPVLDIKLSLLYAATFGWGFVLRLAAISVPIVLGGSMLVQAVAG